MTPPAYIPQVQADGSFVMLGANDPITVCSTASITIIQAMELVVKLKNENPDCDFWVDGDKGAIMSKKRRW